jgi:hypothetical protein
LVRAVAEKYGHLPADRLIEKLCEIGVVDHHLCKILAVRRHVDHLVRRGEGKMDAMWMASEHFCVTYEFVRKSVYYYTDVTI